MKIGKSLCIVVMALACPAWAGGEPGGGAELSGASGLTWGQVAGVLAAVGASGLLGWQGCKKMQAMRIEPQPLEVKERKDYVTREEFEQYRRDTQDDFDRLHKRLDDVTPAVAEIKGEMKRLAQTQTQILDLLLTRKGTKA